MVDPDMTKKSTAVIPKSAFWLGLAGLLPFLLTSVLVWSPTTLTGPLYNFQADNLARLGLAIQIHYSGLILTFLGAVHWGALMRFDAARARGYIWGIIPSLFVWLIVSLFSLIRLPKIKEGLVAPLIFARYYFL